MLEKLFKPTHKYRNLTIEIWELISVTDNKLDNDTAQLTRKVEEFLTKKGIKFFINKFHSS